MTRSPHLRLAWLATILFDAMAVACSNSPPAASQAAAAQPDATAPGNDAGEGGPPIDSGPPADAGTVTISREGGVPISAFAFGQNYWDWVDRAGTGVTGITGTEALVTALHLDVLRAGGNNNDTNSPQPFDATQIDHYVAYCRTVGAEPILQVPILANAVDGGATSPQTAADMVTYANVTQGYGIKYWEIGNEPDIYAVTYDAGVPLTAVDYCAVYSSYAAAMRTANASASDGGVPLQFVGPDLAYKYISGNDWLTPFLDGCKDDVDIVSVHRYPFSAMSLSIARALDDSASFRSQLASVNAIVKGHARPGTPLAVTESNVSYDYDPTAYADAEAQGAPGTFNAALWTADALGVALENDLWTLAFWNLGETDAVGSVLGFIVSAQPVPSYYGEQLLSSHLRGNIVIPTGAPSGFSVYASHDATAATTAIVVINKTPQASSLALALDGVTPASFAFAAMSITVVEIPDDGTGMTHVWRYTPDLAAANLPPAQVQ
jgi:hypothetical protein